VLHPDGAIDHSTYERIAPAYARIAQLEPFLEDAVQVTEIAILSAEYMRSGASRPHPSDEGAVQMLLEAHRPFDVIDSHARFEDYRLIILPDEIAVDGPLAQRLEAFVAGGGKVLASWRAGQDEHGAFALDFGLCVEAQDTGFQPTYAAMTHGLDARIPASPVVFYEDAPRIRAQGAEVLGVIRPPYFNRTAERFCSHKHTPEDVHAAPSGVAASIHQGKAYIAFPIFRLYRAVGQPVYRYIVEALIDRLLPHATVTTDLPSAGRLTLTHQARNKRYVLHLLYGPAQVRGHAMPIEGGGTRIMEIIEDIPAIGPVSACVRLPRPPTCCYDALSGEPLGWTSGAQGEVRVTVPRLRIHTAVVFETQ
jgi:hypothetical protein